MVIREEKQFFDIPLVIPYRECVLHSSMCPSETVKVKTIAQMEQQIQAPQEQTDIKESALTASNRPRQLVKTSRYKDYSMFASLSSFALQQTMG